MEELPAKQTKPAAKGGLKVIGAGFGRTGTLSLKFALEELGFGPCYHMSELLKTPEHLPLWEAASRGEAIEWADIFAGYRAAVDWPTCSFYEQLMHAYPQAKFILTVRDPESWYESASNTIFYTRIKAAQSPVISRLFFMLAALSPGMRTASRIMNSPMWNRTIGVRVEDKQQAIAFFTQHIENVKQRIPAERLLVYEVKEGWEPLCAFLGVEVPTDKPFPCLNDRASFPVTKMMEVYRRRLTALSIGVGLLLALLLFRQWQNAAKRSRFT
ncbi:MAG TPA: sulfotransferase [Ktedonobacteraceae bacterium]|nr:sulfotransferase [Ktedonobacteraceae bacterium]